MAELESLRSDQIATIYGRRYPRVNTRGVRFGDMDKLVKRIGRNSLLARQLWDAGVLEARLIATRVMHPSEISEAEIDLWAHAVD